MRWIINALVAVLAFTAPAIGQEDVISVNASLSQQQAYVGEILEYQIVVQNAKPDDVPEIRWPEGVEATYAGSNSMPQQYSTLDPATGRMKLVSQNTTLLSYRLVCTDQGTHTIPGTTITINGKKYDIDSVSFEILDAPEAEDFDVVAELDRTRVYVGETLHLQVHWYLSASVSEYSFRPSDKPDSFEAVEDDAANQLSKREELYPIDIYGIRTVARLGDAIYNGQQMREIYFEVLLRPAKPGTYDLGPVGVLFDRRTARGSNARLISKSDSIKVEVLSPPTSGQLATTEPVDAASSPTDSWKKLFSPGTLLQTVGFWEGQRLSLERIRTEHPTYSKEASHLSLQLESRFGPGISAISEYGRSRVTSWDEMVQDSTQVVRKMLASQSLSDTEIQEFLDDVELRLDGVFPAKIGEAILSFHPKYDRQPSLEFNDRLKKELRSEGEEKAMGLKLAMSYPSSWTRENGRGPHILTVFKSKGGHGEASVLIQVRNLPADLDRDSFTIEDLRESTSPQAVTNAMPGAVFIDRGDTTVAGQPAVWSRLLATQETVGVHARMLMWSISLVYENHFVMIQLSVGRATSTDEPPVDDRDLETAFEHWEPTFKQMLISFDIHNRHEVP